MNHEKDVQFTAAGTNINEVKQKNAQAGLSYNEVKALLAKSGGHGTSIYSDTDIDEVKQDIHKHQQ
ncbi:MULTISPECIES: gamma-type small acid-soluble spore protein [Lysinibacillus]|uniref:gamma-type small acid-soluble spore protein n=1 Tax=Lysinibacillus TaxID=400634 RepID=UPI001C8BDA1E|nr:MULTISPECIES: gamma-type small acid-soluble spore protein [Lysinibacillus]MBX8946253.1 gamma-type small acid-soluble spore protein [Lysinibacillus sp. K60]UNT56267.1 gamma-type small acid-soluble spore protein [Lysinibacillus capsici]UUV23906.1 gamma-type small acid-soluble spore protein [Lysinibacillus sp. FN11]UYB46778.1 gamma-type small acid-soluble spore protein [Lysinibacillus capsici]